MYNAGEQEKKKFTKTWPTNYKYYMGDQWSPFRPSWKSSPVENHIFSKTETVLPILTDAEPKIDVLPRSGQYIEYADMMQSLLDYIAERNDDQLQTVLAAKNALIFGCGFFYNYYDPDDHEIFGKSVNPQNLTPDPDATGMYDVRYMSHIDQMSNTEIEATWPDAVGKIRRGARTFADPDNFRESMNITGYAEAFSGFEYPETAGGSLSRIVPWVTADLTETGHEGETSQVIQWWVRDPEVVEEELRDEDDEVLTYPDGEPIIISRPKYPQGRQIVVVGDRIIHDGLAPFIMPGGGPPYTKLDCHPFPGEFWPVSMVQNMISPQKTLNKINGLIIDNAKLVGSGVWTVERGSGVKARQITGRPGMVVTYNRGYTVKREAGTPLPNFIGQLPDMLRAVLDSIPGVHDVTTGRKPGGITAGVAIESLQEAAQTRIRLLVRNLEGFIRHTGQQRIALAQQFFTEARMIRIVDEMGQFQFVELTPEMIEGQWEVVVAAGSSVPRSREARERQALALQQAGIFGPEDVLDWIDHPGKHKVLRRIKAVQAMQAEMGGMLDQAGAPPGGGNIGVQLGPQPSKKPQVSGRGNGPSGPPRL